MITSKSLATLAPEAEFSLVTLGTGEGEGVVFSRVLRLLVPAAAAFPVACDGGGVEKTVLV